MRLVIGGYAQGKLVYVKKYMCRPGEEPVILNHLNLQIRECLQAGRCPEQELEQYLKENPDCIIICDEIGNGIIPMDSFEREYRERTGRILIWLAEQAEEVVRVICGLGQKIK